MLLQQEMKQYIELEMHKCNNRAKLTNLKDIKIYGISWKDKREESYINNLIIRNKIMKRECFIQLRINRIEDNFIRENQNSVFFLNQKNWI